MPLPSETGRIGLALLVWLSVAQASAQLNVAPSSHWGASMYPALRPGYSAGFELLAFTQLGKDTRTADGAPLTPKECGDARRAAMVDSNAPCGEPDPYNYLNKTIGLNLLSFVVTRPLKRYDVRGSNLLYTHTVLAGWVNDTLTEFFQNDVVHAASQLQRIRREKIACGRGDTWDPFNCLALGYGGELDYLVHSFDRVDRGLAIRETPFFVGSGFLFSNIESELYSHLGIRRFDLTGPLHDGLSRVVTFSLSAMTRAGMLVPGAIFEGLANLYVAAEGSLAAHFAPYNWPVTLEFGFVGSTGQFINEPRQWTADNREVQSGKAPVPMPERMYRLRVELGEFTFETYNDAAGGKDKGPSFGARMLYTFVPGTTEARCLQNLRKCFSREGRGSAR